MDAKRNFLEAALSTGMECQIITPSDVLRHIEPDVLASHLPDDAKTALLSASIKAGRMDADLVFEVIEPRVFAEHMPEPMLWSCVAEAAEKALDADKVQASRLGSQLAARPTASPLGDASKVASPLGDASKAASPLGDRLASRRSTPQVTASRRPVRLSQARAKTKPGGVEFDIDPDLKASWPAAEGNSEEPFTDWVEETVTGPDGMLRRKR